MDFLKKLSVGTYVIVGAALLAIIGLIMGFVSGSSLEFPVAEMPIIITFTILAIILMCGAVAAVLMFGDKPWMSVALPVILLAATVLLSFCFFNMFMGRSVLMGGIWFSDLDKGYAVAENALSNGVISMVFYLLSALTVSVAAAFKLGKKEA